MLMNRYQQKPLYYQLKQIILKWIENEKYLPGDLLPSEKDLREMHDISRTTVRLALKELEQEGFIIRRPGKGTFVACNKMESGPRRLLSFTDEMVSFGFSPSSQIVSLEKEQPATRTAKLLEIGEESPVWRLERIRMADGAAMVTEINYIPCHIVRDLDVSILAHGSFYDYLERAHGIVITCAREHVEARLANTRESRQLGVTKGSPVLHVERLTFGYPKSRPMTQIPIELVKMVYNAEKYTFNILIKKE